MANKTKKIDNIQSTITEGVQALGMAVMLTAATAGLVELPERDKKAIIIPNKPVFEFATENNEPGNALRREREETAPHHISYSETQRTPGRTGKY